MQKFKTNIATVECIQRVSPYLEDEASIVFWHVDSDHPDNILSIKTTQLQPNDVLAILRRAGFIGKVLLEEAI